MADAFFLVKTSSPLFPTALVTTLSNWRATQKMDPRRKVCIHIVVSFWLPSRTSVC